MELTEWMAYDSISPFGPERDELRTGLIAAMLANMFRSKGKGSGAALAKPSDFLLFKPPVSKAAKAKILFASLAPYRRKKDG